MRRIVLENLDYHGLTDRGRKRETNQDQFLIADLIKTMRINDTSLHVDTHARLSGHSQAKLLLVADGMGGHLAGERASTLAIETLNTYVLNTMHWFFRLEEDREHDFELDLKSALETCQTEVRAEAASVPSEFGMGTTVTMAYLIWPRMYVVHVGDSRCYILRGSKLQQITTDHTMAEQFVEAGVLKPDEVDESRWSHVLWNVVGGNEEGLQPVVYKSELAAGDTVLLCTDGLTRHVSNGTLAELLAGPFTAKETCKLLVDAANDAGGTDDTTVVVARF
jgi:serine/threonine protein phosphatase PrpC